MSLWWLFLFFILKCSPQNPLICFLGWWGFFFFLNEFLHVVSYLEVMSYSIRIDSKKSSAVKLYPFKSWSQPSLESASDLTLLPCSFLSCKVRIFYSLIWPFVKMDWSSVYVTMCVKPLHKISVLSLRSVLLAISFSVVGIYEQHETVDVTNVLVSWKSWLCFL